MNIKISSIEIDPSRYIREGIDNALVAEYAALMQQAVQFPPVLVFEEGRHRLLCDGHHRVRAAQMSRAQEIEAEIRHGNRQDALRTALVENRKHGARMTAGDKRRAIHLALREFPDKSQSFIAQLVGCAQSYVCEVKNDSEVIATDNLPVAVVDGGNTEMTEPLGVDRVAVRGKVSDPLVDKHAPGVEDAPDPVSIAVNGGQPALVIGVDGKHYPARRARHTGPLRPMGRDTMAQLRHYWRLATQAEREAFVNWIQEEELYGNHDPADDERPDDAGDKPDTRDDDRDAARDEQDESEG